MFEMSWRAVALSCAGLALPAAAGAETLIGPYPFAAGDKFVYAYASTDSLQTGSDTPVVTKISYTQTTTVLPAVKYDYPPSGGTVIAYPVQTTATWEGAEGTYTLKNIEYRNFVAGGASTRYLYYGYRTDITVAEPQNVTLHETTARVFGAPYILDELPEKAAAAWAEPIAWTQSTDNYYATSQGDSNVLTSRFASGATGAYTDSGMNFDVPYEIVQKANSTGTNTIGPGTAQEQWSFGLPEESAGSEIIPVTVTFDGKSGLNTVPDWFPGGGAAPQPLTTQTMTDKGMVKVPAGCGKYAGKPAELLEAKYSQLAPVAGYTLDETDAWYVIAKIGRACLTVSYTRTDYSSEDSGEVKSVDVFSSSAGLIAETLK